MAYISYKRGIYDGESTRRYIDTAICKNIQHSLSCCKRLKDLHISPIYCILPIEATHGGCKRNARNRKNNQALDRGEVFKCG